MQWHLRDSIPIVTVTSPNYDSVFRYWRESLNDVGYPEDLQHVTMLPHLEPPYGFCTGSWAKAIGKQVEGVVEYIGSHQGEWVLFTDADLQFFSPFRLALSSWKRHACAANLDLLFMREQSCVLTNMADGEVNSGLYLCRCSERTLQFFKEVLRRLVADPKMSGYPPYLDQYHVNMLLQDRGVRSGAKAAWFSVQWDYLRDEHCIWGDDLTYVDTAAFHHAVNTHDKPRQLASVRKHVRKRQNDVGLRWFKHVEEFYSQAWHSRGIGTRLCNTCWHSVGIDDGGAGAEQDWYCKRCWVKWEAHSNTKPVQLLDWDIVD